MANENPGCEAAPRKRHCISSARLQTDKRRLYGGARPIEGTLCVFAEGLSDHLLGTSTSSRGERQVIPKQPVTHMPHGRHIASTPKNREPIVANASSRAHPTPNVLDLPVQSFSSTLSRQSCSRSRANDVNDVTRLSYKVTSSIKRYINISYRQGYLHGKQGRVVIVTTKIMQKFTKGAQTLIV
jgi:hypothetical protein